jgi:hypothetical protein
LIYRGGLMLIYKIFPYQKKEEWITYDI